MGLSRRSYRSDDNFQSRLTNGLPVDQTPEGHEPGLPGKRP